MTNHREPDCELMLGLDDDDRALLSGFTGRAFAALVHLREAWLVADASNGTAIENAVVALMGGHSFADNADLVRKILSAGCPSDQRGLAALVGGADVSR